MSEFWDQVAIHEARGCSRAVALDAARTVLAEAKLYERWDEALHQRNRRGQFIDTDSHGNPREASGGGGGLGSFPSLTPKQVGKLLKRGGFQHVGTKGSHAKWAPPNGGRPVIVPMHSRSVPKGTLRQIMGTAALGVAG